MSQVSRTTLSQSVTDQLLTRFHSGVYAVGDKLPTMSEFMEEFGVGRNTVREAMQALVVMGLVEVRPRVGTTVKAASGAVAANTLALSALLDASGRSDLYEFRRVVEVAAAGMAAERATESEIETIGNLTSRYLYDVENGLHTYENDVALHQAIAEASHNAYFIKILKDVTVLLAAVRRETELVPGAVRRAATDHVALMEAIRARDPEAARTAMAVHIESAIWALDQALKNPPNRESH